MTINSVPSSERLAFEEGRLTTIRINGVLERVTFYARPAGAPPSLGRFGWGEEFREVAQVNESDGLICYVGVG